MLKYTNTAAKAPPAEPSPESMLEWNPITRREWCARVDLEQEPEWLIENVIPSDAAVMISGPPKRGFKTFFLLVLAEIAASGQAVGMLKPTGVIPTLFLLFEGARKKTRGRFTMLHNGLGIGGPSSAGPYFSHREKVLLDDPTWIARLKAFIVAKGIKLVIIDTFAKAHRGDENNVKDISAIMRAIDDLRGCGSGTSVVFSHHLRKPSRDVASMDDCDDDLRGSSALAGFYDVHIAVRKPHANHDYLSVTIRSKDDEETRYELIWKFGGKAEEAPWVRFDLAKAQEGALLPSMLDKAVALLAASEVYTKKELADIWQLDKYLAEQTIASLIEDGILEAAGKGLKLKGG